MSSLKVLLAFKLESIPSNTCQTTNVSDGLISFDSSAMLDSNALG